MERIFHIAEKPISKAQKVRATAIMTAAYVLLFEVIKSLVPWRGEERRFFDPTEWLILGAVYFAISYFWPSRRSNYDVSLGDAGIRLFRDGVVLVTVPKDRVHYVREWGTRLVVSKPPLRTRLVGPGISIPRSLPEYEEIKALVLSWSHSSPL